MDLRDGIIATRDALGEMVQGYWNDWKIINDLNISARNMCSYAQFLNTTWQTNIPAQTQEVELPQDCETVTGVSIYSGSIFPLKPVDKQQLVQRGNFTSSIPARFYIRRGSATLSPQTSTGQRAVTPIAEKATVRTILGLWPIPFQAYPCWVDYLQYHPRMQNLLDECFIPPGFEAPWYAYAIAEGKRKEGAVDEADYFQKIHDNGKEAFKLWQENNAQEVAPPRYGDADRNSLTDRPASTVIIVDMNSGIL